MLEIGLILSHREYVHTRTQNGPEKHSLENTFFHIIVEQKKMRFHDVRIFLHE